MVEQENFSDNPLFNGGIDYVGRLNELCRYCNYFYINRMFDQWTLSVKALHRELSPKMNDKENTKFEELVSGATIQNIKREVIFKEDKISKGERYLRFMMSKKGLLMPSKDDPGNAMI